MHVPNNPGEAGIWQDTPKDSLANETIPLVALNDIMAGIDAILLKIDVEGFEYEVRIAFFSTHA